MASRDQNLYDQIDGYWQRDINEDGNKVACTVQIPESMFASDLTITEPFKTDDRYCNVKPDSTTSKQSQVVCDLTSSATVNYISKILLEEDLDYDDEINIYQNMAVLRDTEKSFYEILGQEYPLLPNTTNESSLSNKTICILSDNNPFMNKCKPFDACNNPISFTVQRVEDTLIQRGIKEAMNSVPIIGKPCIDLEKNRTKFHQEPKQNCFIANLETRYESSAKMRSFTTEPDIPDMEARKKRTIFEDEPARNESFDELLLSHGKEYFEDVISLREILRKEMENNSVEVMEILSNQMALKLMQHEEWSIDFESLLINCSTAVSTNDHKTAYEIIRKIRKHSTPKGYCYQRLAHYLVDALEARLAGTGSDTYHKLMSKQGSATDLLKGFRIYHAVCPYPRASIFFANERILNISRNASRIHIIDFGIEYGFQWPSFFERISSLPTLPKIRMTGVGFPMKGFHPEKRVQETGRRLSEYAERFNIRLKYHGIASKWENIRSEDLRLDKGEILIVNSLFGFRNLGDETISMDSARDKVLRLIRKIKPHLFIHGIINSSYSNPFFTTRFRNVFSKFFSLFDMFDSTMPRDSEARLLIERNILSPKAMNVIACEGSERVERPETYRQWQTRNLRAGFVQLPVDSLIKKKIERTVRGLYHKEFVVDESNKWLLLGWKGSIAFALSTWKPS